MLQRNRNNMPPDFEPPVPAWSADWSGGFSRLTSAFFGVQREETPSWKAWADTALRAARAHAPLLVEKATYVDAAGVTNFVYIAYWRDDGYEQWWSREDVSGWWSAAARAEEGVGYWREVSHVTPDRIETLHSSPNAHGIASLTDELEGPVEEHAYPGAARDRIPVSGSDALRGEDAVGAVLMARVSDGGRRVVVEPPVNMCIIRSGQDWGHCGDDESEFYLTEVEPSLRAGMDYLRDNPEESRCLSMRLLRCVGNDGEPMQQTFGLGYGLDIYAFEEWAKSHPTHTKIFEQFMGHADRFGESMELRLWHEVSVVQNDGTDFEYIGCHPQTGLLPYAASA